MSKNKHTYLEERLDAVITSEENLTTFVFQKERIGLKRSSEIDFIKDADSEIRREISMTEDELIIRATIPKTFKSFDSLIVEDEKTRLIFAHQLINKIRSHSYPRLNLMICPDNIVYNTGMTPFFIHYGVMESLPPFETSEQRSWMETKAAVAAAIDRSHTFEEYVKFHETLELKETGKAIMAMADSQSLLNYINEQLIRVADKEKTMIKLPSRKWRTSKWASIGLGLLLVPAVIFSFYYFIYEKPRNEAYLSSHEQYLGNKYSEVVTLLSPHSVKQMPYVVLYELAHSYVMNEGLTEEQKKNILNNVSLRTDEEYLKYWIYIGRGEAEKAIDLSRSMEDVELISYGLLKRSEEIQADTTLSGEEKQQLLKAIDNEVDEYEKLLKEDEE